MGGSWLLLCTWCAHHPQSKYLDWLQRLPIRSSHQLHPSYFTKRNQCTGSELQKDSRQRQFKLIYSTWLAAAGAKSSPWDRALESESQASSARRWRSCSCEGSSSPRANLLDRPFHTYLWINDSCLPRYYYEMRSNVVTVVVVVVVVDVVRFASLHVVAAIWMNKFFFFFFFNSENCPNLARNLWWKSTRFSLPKDHPKLLKLILVGGRREKRRWVITVKSRRCNEVCLRYCKSAYLLFVNP